MLVRMFDARSRSQACVAGTLREMSGRPHIDELEQRLRAMDPVDFEALSADLVTELGFIDVRRQSSGTQFGHDIAAEFVDVDKEAWLFECKRYSSIIPAKEISNKIVWADTLVRLDYFVIISNSTLANDFAQLIRMRTHRRYKILAWTGPTFRRLLAACPRTTRSWFSIVVEPESTPSEFLELERGAASAGVASVADGGETVTVEVRRSRKTPGENPSYAVITDFMGRRLAKLSLRRGAIVRIKLPKTLLGKPIQIIYDFDPHACVARHYPHVENILLTHELQLPSENLKARIASVLRVPTETWRQYTGTFFRSGPSLPDVVR
jgi:restriction endonuclease